MDPLLWFLAIACEHTRSFVAIACSVVIMPKALLKITLSNLESVRIYQATSTSSSGIWYGRDMPRCLSVRRIGFFVPGWHADLGLNSAFPKA